jgi:hypothetical protein
MTAAPTDIRYEVQVTWSGTGGGVGNSRSNTDLGQAIHDFESVLATDIATVVLFRSVEHDLGSCTPESVRELRLARPQQNDGTESMGIDVFLVDAAGNDVDGGFVARRESEIPVVLGRYWALHPESRDTTAQVNFVEEVHTVLAEATSGAVVVHKNRATPTEVVALRPLIQRQIEDRTVF